MKNPNKINHFPMEGIMKKLLTVIFALFILSSISFAQVFSKTTGGEWDQATTWVNGVTPTSTDSVIIQGPVRLFFDNPTVQHIQITADGSLQSGWESIITVSGNVWMNGPVNCGEGNFEFKIGGNLTMNADWLGPLTFTGTSDHYLFQASTTVLNPQTLLLAAESKIIATSNIKIVSTNFPNIVAKEIDLTGGFSIYLSKIRLGYSLYYTNNNIRTKVTGGIGSSIYMNVGAPTGMDQWYIEYCDLEDVTLKGNTFIGASVKLLGDVVNDDSLFTASGTGSWDVEVEGNFTNNDLVSSNLKFNFYQNFTNNGSFTCTYLNFIGSNDHEFTTTGNGWLRFNSEFNSLDGKLIIIGNTFIKSTFNYLVAKEIVLETGSNLYLDNVRFGHSTVAFKNIVTGNGNFIQMSGSNGWYEKCDLYDVQLKGYSIVRGDVDFYGEVINQDTLTNNGTNETIDVLGNFTNNGRIYGNSYDMNFNFHKNLTNNGFYSSTFTQFVGDEDQYIVLSNSETLLQSIQLNSNFTTTPSSYQWMKNDVDIANATNENLLFSTGLVTDQAVYQCKGNNGGADVFSRKIYVGTELPPAFEITDVVIKNIDSSSTMVMWKTTVPATGFIFYAENDASSGYPLEAMEPEELVTVHFLLLEDLNFGSTYYFIIDQNDEGWTNNVRSEEFSFVAGDFTLGALAINSIVDVPEDQGGWVYVNFDADIMDAAGDIKLYGIYEWMNEEWVSLGSVPATQDSAYTFLAHTYKDSTDNGIYWSKFYISAHSTDPLVFFNSKVDSGYSIDNLAPEVPTGLTPFLPNNGTYVQLSWNRNMEADLNYYTIYRNDEKIGTTTDTLFVDNNVVEADYFYKITANDFNGNESDFSESVSVIVGVNDEAQLPTKFSLSQNYPNPFNPSTTIKYSIPVAAGKENIRSVQLIVYNMLGRKVATLVNQKQAPGRYEVIFNADQLASGTYIYRIIAGSFVAIKKLILIK